MTENKRYTKEYFDEYNKDYDFIEKDILTIFDNVSNKKYFMEFLDDDDMNNTIDELINRLNEQDEEIQELKQRNNRQYERLKELTDLMFKRDWKTLELMVDEWEKEEEQLQKYGG